VAPFPRSDRRRSPRATARLELLRAALGLLRGALALPSAWIEGEGLRAETLDCVRHAQAPGWTEPPAPEARALTLFIAAAEASGETHAVSLVRALRRRLEQAGAPPPRLLGFGGERLAAEGVELLGNPVDRATMDAGEAARGVGFYAGLLERLAACLDAEPVDAFVSVDSPALHVPMASVARSRGVRTVHFIAPQYWAWAPWRAARYRRVMDLGLTILPFEPEWFRRRRVRVAHVGHPILETLPQVAPPDDPARRDLVLLPGSRAAEIRDNLPWLLDRLGALELEPGRPIVVLQTSDRHRAQIEGLLAAHGRGVRLRIASLHEGLATARTALAVSGTVLLEVAHHRLPTVVLYRVVGGWKPLLKGLLLAPWFSKPNLLAGEEVLPEFGFVGEGEPERFEATARRLDQDEAARRAVRRGLDRAFMRLGPPGAADRAAALVLAEATGTLPSNPRNR
jgi:lipid-A-disaccharide synthase